MWYVISIVALAVILPIWLLPGIAFAVVRIVDGWPRENRFTVCWQAVLILFLWPLMLNSKR